MYGNRRLRRGAVTLALLCAAVVGMLGGSSTAFAQVSTVWSATLTAGRDAFGGSVWGWRSIDIAMNGDDLTDTTVTFEGVDYPLYSILVVQVTDFNERLILSFSGVSAGSELLDPRVQRAMEFRVGGDSFNLGDAHGMTFTRGILSFNWDFTDYYWTTGDEFAVSLVDTRLKISSARVIDPYFVEVTFNKNLRAAAPGNLVSINVGGRRYPMGTTIVHCRRVGGQNYGCSGTENARWLWIQLRWPIYSGDTVTFSYSPDAKGGSKLVDRARGDPFPEVRNYPVTNNSSAGKSTVTIERIGATAPEGGRFSYRLRATANGAIWPSSSKTVSGNAGQHTYSMKYVGPPVTVKYRWRDASAGGLAESRIELQRAARDGNNYWDIEELVQRDAANGPLTVRVAPGFAYNVGTDSSICIRITGSPNGPACSSSQVSTEPLTAEFDEVPSAHNATAFDFQVAFSEAVSATAEQVRSAVSATGATVTAAALADGSDTVWNVTVTPSGTGTVELSLGLTESCTDTGAICTADGRKLSSAVLHQIAFAPWLTVADASATEGTNATMDFTVTLAPAASETVTVDYATSDGTATAPSDYTAQSGALTFAAGETSKSVSVPIVDDSQPDNGETFTLTLSNASGGAVIADAEATGTIENSEAATFAASFVDLPATHDGRADIVFELRFNQNLPSTFSYTTLLNRAFSVSNGTVEAVERIVKTGAQRNRRWTIKVDPDAAGQNVGISLAATTNCAAIGAICNADNDPLSTGVSGTVAPKPESEVKADLTVAYTTEPPAEHDGSSAFSVAFSFSENLASGFSYTTIRDAFAVTQGGASLTPSVARKVRGGGNDQHWTATVTPSGRGDISIGLSASASCGSTGAICTDDDRALSNALAARTVQGPPGLSVADTDATEGTDASMNFTVTLGRAASAPVTVAYATSDGTATAGADYTETSGRLTFAAGETSKTVEVPILTDTVDDDGETFTLTLSNASGGNAYLADATAIGTIRNQGGMPRAWITRFGRTVAGQVVDAVGARMEGGGGNHVQVGGFALNAGAGTVLEDERLQRLGVDGLSERAAERTLDMSPRDLLLASAFNLSAGGEAGGPAFGAWGRFEMGSFEAEDDGLPMDGDVTTGFLGADVAGDRWLAGVAVSFSEGDGEFAAVEGDHAGTVESSLTSFYPYARVALNDRVSAWGLVGAGSGELTLRHGQGDAERVEITTDIAMRMGAMGVRGEVLAPSEPGGLEVAIKSDAFWVRTESDEVRSPNGHLMGAEGDATRVRLLVEASGAHETAGGTLTPSAEIGLRHDGGDAETGTGLEVAGALRYARGGLTIEGRVRTLLAHEASGYEEWGAAGTVRIDPGASGRGLSLTVAPSIGAPGSGTSGLRGAGDARALAGEGGFEAGRRLDTEVGYGLGVPGTLGLVTPYAGLSLAEDAHRRWRTGARWQVAPEVALGLEASGGGGGDADNAVMLRAQAQF